MAIVTTSREYFMTIKEALESRGYALSEANLELIPANYIELDELQTEKLAKMIEMIEKITRRSACADTKKLVVKNHPVTNRKAVITT